MLFLLFGNPVRAQSANPSQGGDSINIRLMQVLKKRIADYRMKDVIDSLKSVELEQQWMNLSPSDNLERMAIRTHQAAFEQDKAKRTAVLKELADSIQVLAVGFPVVGIFNDTLFYLYNKIGPFNPSDRALAIHNKLKLLYKDDFLKVDSIRTTSSEYTVDIGYNDITLMSVTESDGRWENMTANEMAERNLSIFRKDLLDAKAATSNDKLYKRIGLLMLIFLGIFLCIWLLHKVNSRLIRYVQENQNTWLKRLRFKNYTFLTPEEELAILLVFFKGVRWVFYLALAYLSLPLIFSVFPFTRGWADTLFGLVWGPLKKILLATWQYLPHVFTILVIYFVFKYIIRFIQFLFTEIEEGKLVVSGFHADWAKPTYGIVRFLLYALMFVMMYPHLPGSDSKIFQGVSVFIGILFSLGSSSAIANMVAGLVMTYMRPFQIGDQIQIGDISGAVVEKSILVTRLRSAKNEIITIPNSTILTGNTINFSHESGQRELILSVDVMAPVTTNWSAVHEALLEAASRTHEIEKTPAPYVLQTKVDAVNVVYTLHGFTHSSEQQKVILSELYRHILDVRKERSI